MAIEDSVDGINAYSEWADGVNTRSIIEFIDGRMVRGASQFDGVLMDGEWVGMLSDLPIESATRDGLVPIAAEEFESRWRLATDRTS